eukprot:CAMPEP_0202027598 /NCGR_PEP_ID=MMETSP0905-20130828/61868_1 /ASSEMBLY_ACC=CAM_ASM_000554 /TAXON_ID=420261 /ORGANISM="Thalassiosira antarctica, Strain CCMP982" /LENGTH=39 /DNA_ID= /DNA_START= /DNA_END= /DNA_ORIENTATION=
MAGGAACFFGTTSVSYGGKVGGYTSTNLHQPPARPVGAF